MTLSKVMCYTARDAVDWYHSPTARTVKERLQPQPLCCIVNQLDTARRFMWNEVTKAKSPVDPRRHQNTKRRISQMIYVGIDVAKDKCIKFDRHKRHKHTNINAKKPHCLLQFRYSDYLYLILLKGMFIYIT